MNVRADAVPIADYLFITSGDPSFPPNYILSILLQLAAWSLAQSAALGEPIAFPHGWRLETHCRTTTLYWRHETNAWPNGRQVVTRCKVS